MHTLILKSALLSAFMSLSACAPISSPTQNPSVAIEVSQVPFSPELEDWPHVKSDLKPDERVHFGRMPNGLRYAILPAPDKNGTVSIHMSVAAGFNDEPADAYGVAHLLEHMAFRGARAANEGSIIHDLETMGARHGRDVNGFTYPDHTLYIVNLPTNARKPVEVAIRNMSQLAIKPNLSENNLSLEKDVVIAEMNLRNTVRARANLSSTTFENPSNKRNTAPGIGTKDSINNISLSEVEKFHSAHYTPDNTLITIAGDVKVTQIKKILSDHFSGWPSGEEAFLNIEKTSVLELENLPKMEAFKEKGSTTTLRAIENLPSSKANDTVSFRERKFAESIALSIFNTRLKNRIVEDKTVEWVTPFYTRNEDYDLRGVRIGAKDYLKAMTYFEEERLRILKYGFGVDEIEFALEQERATLESLTEQPEKISAWREASHLRNSFNNGRVYMGNSQNLELFGVHSAKLSVDDYNEAATQNWTNFRPRFWSQSGKFFKFPMEEIVSVADNLSDQEIDQPTTNVDVAFVPSSVLSTSKVSSRDTIFAGKIHRLLYENGTRLNHKQSKKEPDNIEISVTIDGDLDDFIDRYGSIGFRASAFSRADIRGISKLEIDRALTGKKASFSVTLAEGKITISSSTRQRDLETALSLIATFIVDVDFDSKYQQEVFDQRKRRLRNDRNASPIRATEQVQHYEYSGKYSGFTPRSFTELPNTKRDLKKIISEGAVEVGIVGDFEPVALENAFAKSIGGLPLRQSKAQSKLETYDDVTTLEKGLTSLTYRGSEKQMALSYCWPLDRSKEPEDVIFQAINGQVLYNRIVSKLRGDLGITYSPQVRRQSSDIFPNFKFNCFSIQIAPEDELETHDALFEILNELKTVSVTKNEFNRVLAPAKDSMDKRVNSNRTLAYLLASAYSQEEKISEHYQAPRLLKRLKLKAVQDRIAAQFDPEKLHIFRTQRYQSSRALELVDLRVKSHIGDVEAQLELGKRLIISPNKSDRAEGIQTLNAAFENGSISAGISLGKHYIYRDKDLKKAAKYFEPASETKDGAFLLGSLYFNNFATFPDITDERIIHLLKVSAEKGSAQGQYMLAERLKDGTLVERDEIGALKWALISNHTRRGEASIDDEKGKNRFVTGMTEDEIEKAHAGATEWIKYRSP